MNRNSKKGFTIVELIIVIAVIAVLAAVLIPTFSNLIQKANEAKDTALVSNLNKGLKMSSKDFATMHEALQAVEENVGVDVEKISAVATDSKILWDSVNNCFVYLKSGDTKPTYIPDSQKTTVADNEQYKYWEIVETARDDATYSQYLAGDNHTGDVAVNTGFDAGKNANLVSVTYTNTESQSVVIRTNGGELVVDAGNATVAHYGKASSVQITAVYGNSYHEFGEVVGDVVVTKGHFVLESNATVGTIKVSDEAVANEVKVSNNSTNPIVVVDADNKISADSNIGSESVKVTDKEAVALVGDKSYKTLKEALAAVNDGDTLTLIADYRIPESIGDTVEDRLVINKKITFNFGNYRIIGFTKMGENNTNFCALIVGADTTFIAGEKGGVIADEVSDGGPYGVNIINGAKLTIMGGTYLGGGTAVQVQKGTLEILGGKFSVHPYEDPKYGYKFAINAIDAAYKDGTAVISIKGGSFHKFDPSNSKSENPHGSFVADGYRVDSVDEWFTVVKA